MTFKPYHKNLEDLHIGCEKPRAYYIPFESEEKAKVGERDNSMFFFNLCGEWNFRFYDSFEDLEDDFLLLPFCDKQNVPSNWQVDTGKGYDVPLYSNLKYPYPLDPPHVPDENPCGLYNRTLNIEKKKKKYYLNFEGVDSCFYLFVNKEFVGYSQVSHCTSEFDVTDIIKNGNNEIDVLVVKWCDGSYLEDQDCFRFSGIFREVYLLERDIKHNKDIYIKQDVSENLTNAKLNIECDEKYEATVYNPDGEIILKTSDKEIFIDSPVLWNSENPELYTVIIHSGDEYIPFEIGLKRLEIKNAVVYLNGKKIKLYGINRHDSHPGLGHATPVEHMLEDLYILKKCSCNAIRTSHYPNDPRFLTYCDRLGFMVIDEADIETHGMGFEYRDTWDWMRWSMLSTVDEWEDAYVDRAARLFERDKNHVSVVMWSLGNESGCGKNHRKMGKYIKSRDEKAIVHYENSHLEFKAVPEGEDFKDISDVESRMYAPLPYTEEYLKQDNIPKPFYFCEYVCSMSTGDIHAHIDLMEKYDEFFGACIWELTDHAVEITKEDGTKAYRYGGDFGDYPNDSICCIDGLVFPDRSPRPGMYEMKKAYQQFKITDCGLGKVKIFNKKYFTDLSDVYFKWQLVKNGKEILSGNIYDTDIKPREEKSFTLFEGKNISENTYLNIFCYTKNDAVWAEKDYEIGFEQIIYSKEALKLSYPSKAPEFEETKRYVKIFCDNVTYSFDKSYGRLISAVCNGEEIFAEPVKINLWKAHGYNQEGTVKEGKSASIEHIIQKTYSFDIAENDNHIEISFEQSLGGASVVPVLRGKTVYKIYSNGKIDISFIGDKRELAPKLPRFGFEFILKNGFENINYFGYGPNEAYPDRHKACRFDCFENTVTNNFVHYIKPMENSAHFGSIFGEVSNGRTAFKVYSHNEKGFLFNASHFTSDILEKTKHDDELVPLKETVVNIDLQHTICGSNSQYFLDYEPERIWNDNHIKFDFTISVE